MNSIKITRWTTFMLLCISLLVACNKAPVEPPAALSPLPTDAQMAWHEMETNAFIHFSMNTFTGKEWGYGDESPVLFNPGAINADQWISTLKEAGFKTVILTAKHHDGFCLWPSKYTQHSIKNSPYKNGQGDIVREVSDAVKRHGLKFGIYLSPWDRNRADYGKAEYITYYRNQLRELFENYGPFVEMWFDGANGGDGYYGGAKEKRMIDKTSYYDWPGTLSLVRKMSPDIIFFSDAGPGVRWVGNESGVAGETNWNSITIDSLYAGKSGSEKILSSGSEQGKQWVPAEVDVSIRPGWFYHDKEDSLVKTPQQLFEIYLSSVGRGSTLLLNVPPDKDGLIHSNDVKALQGMRALLDEFFKINIAAKSEVSASSYRGGSWKFGPANLLDGDPDTFWCTDDEVTQGSIEIKLSKRQLVRYVVIQEYIKLGQRISSFSIEMDRDGKWVEVIEGTTIGYKRILEVVPFDTKKIRINIKSAKACPVISEIKIF